MSRPGLGFVKMGGRIRGYVVGLGMTGLFLLSSLAYGEENLLRNPGFEEEREGGYPAHWSAHAVGEATFTRDDTVSRSGRYSVRLEGLEPKCRYMVGQWYIPVEGGKRYRFVVYHRVEWLTAPPSIDIHFYDEDREFIKGERYVVRGGVGTNPNWRPIIKEVRAPERARYTTFRVHLFNALGVVWFDDASLTVIEEEAKEEPLTIRRTEIAPLIDGKINDPAWRGAERITDFVITTFGTPLAEKQTLVHLTYDDENLYVIFEVEEPDMEYIRAEVTERDEGRVWADDSIELFITPHFGITYQFIVNSINTVYDARIVVDDRTARGYRREVDWNSSLESAVYLGKDFWRVEMSIPLAEIEINPEEGEIAAINFIGGHKQRIGEFSSFSPLVGAFYQPGRFSTLSFAREKATLRRSAPLPENPLRIVRAEPLFAELLSDEPGGYKVYVWDHVPYQTGVSFLPPVKYQQLPEEEWKEIVKDHFTRMHESGIMGPPLPWAVARNIWWRTEEQLLAWHEKYGTQSIVATESSAPYNQAVAAGAELLNPQAVKKGARPVISWLDPIYVDKVLEEIRSMAERFKDFPYAWAFVGRDEPVISPWKETRETMGPQSKRWDEEIRQEFGFGRFGMPLPGCPSFWERPEDHPFQWSAFNRWMAARYARTRRKKYELLKSLAPEMKYTANNLWKMSGSIAFDFSSMAEHTDLIAINAYASSAERRPGRGIYNHGFYTKKMVDLTGVSVITVCQVFPYAGYTPTPEDIREWASQALKTGASHLQFYEAHCRFHNYPNYVEMLRISCIITTMNRVKVPEDADMAIFYSSDTAGAQGGASLDDELYTAFSFLGERVGSWFDFVSDRQLQRGIRRLCPSIYRVVYLPSITFQRRSIMEMLIDYVRQGGILIVGDPSAFTYDINADSLSSRWEEVAGIRRKRTPLTTARIELVRGKGLLYGLRAGQEFEVIRKTPFYEEIKRVYEFTPLPGTEVLAFISGSQKPALTQRKYGKGKILHFAVNPFIPENLLEGGELEELFRTLQKNIGVEIDRDIWRFLLPSPDCPLPVGKGDWRETS